MKSSGASDAPIKDLFGNDPVAGNAALESLKDSPVEMLPEVMRAAFASSADERQVELRLARACQNWGLASADYLIELISSGRPERYLAAKCFKFLPQDDQVGSRLAKLLEAQNFEVERPAIDALGYLGASGWDFRLIEKATKGSEYEAQKLGFYVMDALIRMVPKEPEPFISSRLHGIARFIRISGHLEDFGSFYPGLRLEQAISEWPTRTADAIISDWLTNEHTLFRKFAAMALRYLRLKRTVRYLCARVSDAGEDNGVRGDAMFAIGHIGGVQACEFLDSLLEQPIDNLPVYSSWALSELFYQRDTWKNADNLLSGMLQQTTEVSAQLVYAFGIRGMHRSRIFDLSESRDGFFRGVAALAITRSRAPDAHKVLTRMQADAGTHLERVLIAAARANAGMPHASHELHQLLVDTPRGQRMMHMLRYPWKREILAGLALGGADQGGMATAWAEILGCDLDRCLEEIRAISEIGAGTEPSSSQPTPGVTKETGSANARTEVFISYSRHDRKWVERLRTMLRPLERSQRFELWDDSRIQPSQKWKEEIAKAIDRAKVAVLLVSAKFLESEFIANNELPPLLAAAEKHGVKVLWALVSPCLYERTEIVDYQAVWPPDEPLAGLHGLAIDEAVKHIAVRISDAYSNAQ